MNISSYAAALKGVPVQGEVLCKGDDRITPYCGDVVKRGNPDLVIRARDVQEISEVLAYCHGHHIPVTFMGGQTGLTGASAAEAGIVVATEKLQSVLDIGPDWAITEPGIFLGELKETIKNESCFYPPDPTSYREARLGGTIATNATGEDTLLYGPTRRYVRALKVIKATGEIVMLKRSSKDRPSLRKGTAGYCYEGSLIDLFIGSEGTLGYIAEATVDILPKSAEFWAAIGFFPSLSTALQFVKDAMSSNRVKPRAMELMDKAALEIFSGAEAVADLPDDAEAAIYWKQEFLDEQEETRGLESWYELFRKAGGQVDAMWLAQGPAKLDQLRRWRHYIPATINEQLEPYREQGGGKVASDWWVPLEYIGPALRETINESNAAGLKPIIFGHIGNGHPHVNYIAQTAEEMKKGVELIKRQCERAVKWGGGVAGEHGLGKIHRHLLGIQHSQKVIDKMVAIKREWDPHWILGRGTLFDVPKEYK